MFRIWDFMGMFTTKATKLKIGFTTVFVAKDSTTFRDERCKMVAKTSHTWVSDLESGDGKERDKNRCAT